MSLAAARRVRIAAIERYWAGRPLPKDVCPAPTLQYTGDDDALQAWVDQFARLHAHLANLALIPALRGGFRARNARRRAHYRRSFVPEWQRCYRCSRRIEVDERFWDDYARRVGVCGYCPGCRTNQVGYWSQRDRPYFAPWVSPF